MPAGISWHRMYHQINASQFPTAIQAFANIELAIGIRRVVPPFAADLSTAQFVELFRIGGSKQQFSLVGLDEQILAQTECGDEFVAETRLAPIQFAVAGVDANVIVARTLAIE